MSSIDNVITACLGSPIAFHRIFARVAGGAANGLFLSQLWYWHDKGGDRDGWIYKTQQDWEAETTLTRREQETARAALRERGILSEQKRGVPAKLYYHLNVQALFEAIRVVAEAAATPTSKDGGNVHPSMAETYNQACAKAPSKDGGNVQASLPESATLVSAKTPSKDGGNRLAITETTTQTTHRLHTNYNNNTAPTVEAVAVDFVVVDEDVKKDWPVCKSSKATIQATHGNLALDTGRPTHAATATAQRPLKMVKGGADSGFVRAGEVALDTTPQPDRSGQREALKAVGIKEPTLSRLSSSHTIEQITAHITAWQAGIYGANTGPGRLINAIEGNWQPAAHSPGEPAKTDEDRARTRARDLETARKDRDEQQQIARRDAAYKALDETSRADILRRAHAKLGGRAIGKEDHIMWSGAFRGAIRCIMAEIEIGG